MLGQGGLEGLGMGPGGIWDLGGGARGGRVCGGGNGKGAYNVTGYGHVRGTGGYLPVEAPAANNYTTRLKINPMKS